MALVLKPLRYDVIVIGGGHAGCEAARASSRLGLRTAMVAMNIDGVPSLLAGFTCTPLVRFPIAGLGKQEKSRGTTVAELGNRNMPLDLIAYRKGGEDYLLMSNNNRGVMKISTREIGREQGIVAPVSSEKLTEGQAFEPVAGLAGTVQLDRLDEGRAVVIRQQEGKLRLETVALP